LFPDDDDDDEDDDPCGWKRMGKLSVVMKYKYLGKQTEFCLFSSAI